MYFGGFEKIPRKINSPPVDRIKVLFLQFRMFKLILNEIVDILMTSKRKSLGMK